MKSLRIHPFFIVLAVIMVLFGKLKLLSATLITVILHEACHYFAAKKRGYAATGFTVMPYGAVLSIDGGLCDSDLFAVALAGPAGNLFIAIVLLALWWILPASYPYTLELFRANIAVAAFNLLPLYPLDGSRILASLLPDKRKCRKATIIISYVFSALLAILYLISAFIKISHAFALASVMLYIGAAFPSDKEKYDLVLHSSYLYRDLSLPMERKELFVHYSVKTATLIKMLKPRYIYSVHIVDGALRTIRTLTDDEIESLFFAEKNRPLRAVLDIKIDNIN